MRLRAAVYVSYGLVAIGCGDNTATSSCLESRLTIGLGIYGQVTYKSGVVSENGMAVPIGQPDVAVTASGANGAGVGISDSEGIYQIELPPGDYTICEDYFISAPCVGVVGWTRGLVRVDYRALLDTSSWDLPDISGCPRSPS